MWVVYHAQGQEGESESAPNVFEVPAPKAGDPVRLRDVAAHFPLARHAPTGAPQFHFRFHYTPPASDGEANGGGGGTHLWLDLTDPAAAVPMTKHGMIIAKVLDPVITVL